MEDRGAGVLLEQRAGGARGFREVAALELDERDEVQEVLVLRTREAGELQLLAGFLEAAAVQALAGASQVEEEDRGIERGRAAGRSRHSGGLANLS